MNVLLRRRKFSYDCFVTRLLLSRLVQNGLLVVNVSRAYTGPSSTNPEDCENVARDGVAAEVLPLLKALQAAGENPRVRGSRPGRAGADLHDAAEFDKGTSDDVGQSGQRGEEGSSCWHEVGSRRMLQEWEEVGTGISVVSARTGDSGAILVNRSLGDWSLGWTEASRALHWTRCAVCEERGEGHGPSVQALVGVSSVRNFDYYT